MSHDISTVNRQALLDFALVLNRQTDFDESLRLVARKAVDILQADSALIMMFNPATQETIKTIFRGGKQIKNKKLHTLQTQITGWMLHQRQSFISQNIREDSRFARLDMTDVKARFAIASLITVGNLTLGSIVLFKSEKALGFGESERSALEYIAASAAPYLHNVEQGLAIIYFPTGTFYLSRTIDVAPNDSNIVFQGAGSERTTLRFANMKDDHCFNVSGTVATAILVSPEFFS